MLDWYLWQDSFTSNFQTTMSWVGQWWGVAFSKWLLAGFFAVVTALVVQVIYAEGPSMSSKPSRDFLIGVSLALFFAGLNALVDVMPTQATPHPDSHDIAAQIPWLATITNAIKSYHVGVVVTLVFAIGLVRFTHTRLRFLLIAGIAGIWWITKGLSSPEPVLALSRGLITLLSILCVIEFIRRKHLGVALVMLRVGIALGRVKIATAPYDGALMHAIIAGIITMCITYGLLRHWYKNKA